VKESFRQSLVVEKIDEKSVLNEQIFVDVIHKIKNGLGGIDGFAALLERDLDPEDPRRRLAQRVQDGVKKVNEVAVSVMLLAREMEGIREPVRIGIFMKQVLNNLLPLSNESHIDVHIDDAMARENVTVHADPRALQRLVQYTFQAISKIGGRLVAVHLENHHSNHVTIEFSFTCEMLKTKWPEDFYLWLDQLHAIEARLALMVVLNIVHDHHGQFVMGSNGDIHTLQYTLKREI